MQLIICIAAYPQAVSATRFTAIPTWHWTAPAPATKEFAAKAYGRFKGEEQPFLVPARKKSSNHPSATWRAADFLQCGLPASQIRTL
ncbi:MAG: hypothetical protein ACLU9T_17610 [Blautia faecis]